MSGSRIELSFKESIAWKARDGGHDPPLPGAEHDRVPRAQTANRTSRTSSRLRLGTMRLDKKGGSQLAPAGAGIPGKQVMDVRAVVLTLQEE